MDEIYGQPPSLGSSLIALILIEVSFAKTVMGSFEFELAELP